MGIKKKQIEKETENAVERGILPVHPSTRRYLPRRRRLSRWVRFANSRNQGSRNSLAGRRWEPSTTVRDM